MEVKIATLQEKVAAIEAGQKLAHQERQQMMDAINTLTTKIDKWEGKFGGFLFAVGCMWAFFSGALKSLVDWIKIKGDV